jgi:hypothetical protein
VVRLGPHSFIALVVQDWVNNRLDALRAYVFGPEAGLSTVLFGLGAVEISIAALVATVLCALLFCMLFRAKSTSPVQTKSTTREHFALHAIPEEAEFSCDQKELDV